jgi:hypothetical protein
MLSRPTFNASFTHAQACLLHDAPKGRGELFTKLRPIDDIANAYAAAAAMGHVKGGFWAWAVENKMVEEARDG